MRRSDAVLAAVAVCAALALVWALGASYQIGFAAGLAQAAA